MRVESLRLYDAVGLREVGLGRWRECGVPRDCGQCFDLGGPVGDVPERRDLRFVALAAFASLWFGRRWDAGIALGRCEEG